ncbi:multiple sugar transport system substrate-binding protein [Paenibacillus cellulosilyticus]|uniref:Multiple sugar transport system substrate-binding protein n=2 Tax=Paenibacillus cellulosilyticus TaxID=375489 RepID=A0A2V2YRM1_9BACL|nr:extracellular solute-binding protein [Paenibacillus cellulosilyticus]PWV98685.1 multiple sugar transport system substrate-binding protein [Paenibacillus cellulosilyticus]
MGVLTGTLVLAVALTGCSSSGGSKESGDLGILDRDDKGTLKIGYFDEQAFYSQYGNAFQAMFPNMTLEVISTEAAANAEDPVAAMEKLIDEQQPDALLLTEEQYAALAKKGKLYDLDAVVKQDNFDLDSYLPSVIELLKARGGGKLYGLSPSFSSQALYYNKDLFDKYGVPYPTNGMSWEDVMQLAKRFPVKKGTAGASLEKVRSDDALYGLTLPVQTTDSFELIRTIGEAKGLLYADRDSKLVTFDTAEWKAVVQSVVDGYKSGSISAPATGNGGGGGGMGGKLMIKGMGGNSTLSFGPDSMRFMSGQSAMSIDDTTLMNMMGVGTNMSVSTNAKGGDDKGGGEAGPGPMGMIDNWDVVSIPSDPAMKDVTGSMKLPNVFAINASGDNLSAAWEFLKYANGDQLAKTSAKSSPTLSSRVAYKTDLGGRNIDAFYTDKVNEQSLLQAETLPAGFANSFAEMAAGQINKAVDGTQTVDEAVKAIQSQGQNLLTKALASEEQA